MRPTTIKGEVIGSKCFIFIYYIGGAVAKEQCREGVGTKTQTRMFLCCFADSLSIWSGVAVTRARHTRGLILFRTAVSLVTLSRSPSLSLGYLNGNAPG